MQYGLHKILTYKKNIRGSVTKERKKEKLTTKSRNLLSDVNIKSVALAQLG